MKIAIYADTKIIAIPKETDAIHLVRPIARKKIERILEKCPKCSEVSMSKSCFKRLPRKTVNFLRKHGINIAAESKRGRAISLPLEKMMHAIELRKDYQSLREIERLTEIPKSTVHYLVKYARREKIKKGDTVIYLK